MHDVRWLRDIEEIKTLKARYGDIVDSLPMTGERGLAQLCGLFTPDTQLDFTDLFGKCLAGHDGLREFFGLLAGNRAWMWHSFSNPIIDVAGDTAKAKWLFYAMSTGRDDPSAAPRLSYGRYEDEYVRAAGGWQQRRLKVFNETRDWGVPSQPTR